jgi:hypothetical protein
MTLFELEFSLGAVVLGLALAHMATNLQRLILAGSRVRWAAEPILLAALIAVVIVTVWLGQWSQRQETSTSIGIILLRVLKLLLPYLAAAFVFPEQPPEHGDVSLFAHYDRTRPYTFGALILGLLLFWADRTIEIGVGQGVTWRSAMWTVPWIYIGPYGLLIFVRNRWVNTLVLAACLVLYAASVLPVTLSE